MESGVSFMSQGAKTLGVKESFSPQSSLQKRKFFKRLPMVSLPNLIETQTVSYDWLLKEGLKELFEEVNPISDFTGKDLELSFGEYYLDEPKYDEKVSKEKNISYEAPLRSAVKLLNKQTGEIKEQEVYLGDLPIMTDRGTFVINGVERVVVSQLIRSPGVFFTMEYQKGKRLFGAKIIPNRGAWLEMETDLDGALWVKIDRKRKVAVTSLLRAFGMATNEEIVKTFADVNKGETNYIEATIERDAAKDQGEGFKEVYKRIRPGDLASVENAKQMIESMFFNFDRYDFGKVGRYRLNQRLDVNVPNDEKYRILRPEDLILIIKEIINLNNNPIAEPDDIDHLGNRRVRCVGELVQNKFRAGLARMSRNIKDRMSTCDLATVVPGQLINSRPVAAAVKEFFASSQLSQFMDQVNPLAELEHKRRLSAMGPGGLTRERAGFEVRDVHQSHYGRICPVQTPEGPNIGLVNHIACYARINEFGFIETPYRKVVLRGGRPYVTNEIEYLNATIEDRKVIAHADIKIGDDGELLEEKLEARVKGKPSIIESTKIDFVDVSPKQCISIATALIPFLEHDDAHRALMGSNMQRQAVSCILPQAPYVGTGLEDKAAADSGQVILAKEEGEVVEVDASHVTVKEEKEGEKPSKRTYWLQNFERSNAFTCMNQVPRVLKGEWLKKNQLIADGASTDKGELALGQNVLVALMPWEGSNFEDAIIISERLLQDDRYTSIHIEDFSVDIRDTKLGPEMVTRDIPNIGEERLKNLDDTGIIHIGAEVSSGDIMVGKISPKGEGDLTPEERLLRAIFGEKSKDVKDTSLYLPHGEHGKVVDIKIFSREQGDKLSAGVIQQIQVSVAQLRKISVGDKLAGRHGNKGVISKIAAVEDMPYLPDGTPVDIILNPLGVASRMNIGQILEAHLGWAASKLGYNAASPSLDGVSEEDIKKELKKAGLPEDGKIGLINGKDGQHFEEKTMVGYMYILKLNHLVEDKIHMRSIGPYSLITQQPLGGKAQFGGQRFGEMEVWALEGYGSAYTLQEMMTIKSDDQLGRSKAYESIIKGEPIKAPNIPASFNVLVNELKGLCLNVDVSGENFDPERKEPIEENKIASSADKETKDIEK